MKNKPLSSQLLDILSGGEQELSVICSSLSVSPQRLEELFVGLESEGVLFHRGDGRVSLGDAAGYGAGLLAWRCGQPVHYVESCGSTNHLASDLAKEGSPVRAIVADSQTAGRGRLDRNWESDPGQNLLMSLVFRYGIPPAEAPRCALLWAAEIADELDLHVKWPNDILDSRDRKVGGLLAEIGLDGGRLDYIVLGVGLNINQCSFPGLPQAASLRMLRGSVQDRALICGRLVQRLQGVDPRGSLGLWRTRASMLGRHVRVGSVEGIARDVLSDGSLLVGERTVLAGDVELVKEV
jgi:BirA family transcriptional regulator, biotin operon repressor / biotin---[acetyl-CoA-carboxylase] ligase